MCTGHMGVSRHHAISNLTVECEQGVVKDTVWEHYNYYLQDTIREHFQLALGSGKCLVG
jgi:hypothetical protein